MLSNLILIAKFRFYVILKVNKYAEQNSLKIVPESSRAAVRWHNVQPLCKGIKTW